MHNQQTKCMNEYSMETFKRLSSLESINRKICWMMDMDVRELEKDKIVFLSCQDLLRDYNQFKTSIERYFKNNRIEKIC